MSQDDWNRLIRAAGDAAIELVEAQGEFLPFAVALNAGGELSRIELELSDDHLQPIEQLRGVLHKEAARGRYRGVAVAEDVQILDPESEALTKAIRVDIEHRDLEPLSWFLTYRQHRGRYQFGDANGEGVLQKGEPAIFADESEDEEDGDEVE
ncbi:MAG TPA: hypothetical protein VHU81_08200 [Thermoanaerobaculia bacterium]|jgi:hypothetical protein|nr:hypothetical protein [Thermoanaerobaculia bacterium]